MEFKRSDFNYAKTLKGFKSRYFRMEEVLKVCNSHYETVLFLNTMISKKLLVRDLKTRLYSITLLGVEYVAEFYSDFTEELENNPAPKPTEITCGICGFTVKIKKEGQKTCGRSYCMNFRNNYIVKKKIYRPSKELEQWRSQ